MNLIYKYLYNQQNKRIIITDLRWDYDLNYGEIDADYFFNNIQQHICIYCALKNPPPQPGTVLYMPKKFFEHNTSDLFEYIYDSNNIIKVMPHD